MAEGVDYVDELRAAQTADLSEIEGRHAVILVKDEDGDLVADSNGNAIVVLIPALIPRNKSAWELTFKLFLRETEKVCSSVVVLGLEKRPFMDEYVLGANFWRKLHYADRIEELWLDDVLLESVARRCIPPIVFTYEGKILEEAAAMREAAALIGAPLMPRQEDDNSERR